jgi:hypothetical protein
MMNLAVTSSKKIYKHNYDNYKNLKFTVLNGGIVKIHFRRSSLKNLERFKIETLEKRKENKPKITVSTITDINKAVRLVQHIYESEKLIINNQLITTGELNEIRKKLNEILEGKTKFNETIEYFSILKEKISKYNFYERLASEKAQKLIYFLENLNEKDSRFEFNSKIMPTFMLLYAIENRIKMRENEIESIITYNKIREDTLRYLRDQYIKEKLVNMREYCERNPYGFKTVYNKDFKTAIYLNKYLGKKMSDFDIDFLYEHAGKEVFEMPKYLIEDLNELINYIYPLNKRAGNYLIKATNSDGDKNIKLKEAYSVLISNNLAYMGENLLITDNKYYNQEANMLIALHKILNRNDFKYFIKLSKKIEDMITSYHN